MIQEVKLNKLIVIGILFLFVCISVYPISGFNLEQSSGNIITVDNEGDGDFTSIKQALNNANQGDSIEVYSGTYYEHDIDVMKEGITLQGISHELGNGNDTGKPFVDGEGNNVVFLVYAINVTIDNFHIENEAGVAGSNIALAQSANGCTLSNNDLANTVMSSIWVESSNNKIFNNNISHSTMRNGIGFYMTSRYNFVSGNNISNVEDGIKLWSSNNNTVTGNKVSNCTRFGIEVASDGNYIEGNSIEYNKNGIHMYGADYNSILNNNLMNNDVNVRYIFEIPGLIKMIRSNRFDGNYWDDWIGIGPKLIWGLVWLIGIPVFDIDWHPVRKPYDI